MKNKWFITYGKVIEINSDHLVLEIINKNEKCYSEDISDYSIDLNRMFTIHRSYKFSVMENDDGSINISYKIGRPKLLKKRSPPTATLNGFKTVSNNMHIHLKEYKIED